MSNSENGPTQSLVVAIPVAEGRLAMHFGHCQEFALFEVDSQSKKVLNDRRLEPPAHQPGVLPAWLRDQGTNLVIAGGMGSRAQMLFAEHGIQVIVGAPSEPPEVILQSHLDGTLQSGNNVCDH